MLLRCICCLLSFSGLILRVRTASIRAGSTGPKVPTGKCFSGDLSTLKSPSHPAGCEVTPRFNDYWAGKVREAVDNYQPDVLCKCTPQNPSRCDLQVCF